MPSCSTCGLRGSPRNPRYRGGRPPAICRKPFCLGEASFAPRAARPEAANQGTSSRPLTCRAICAEAHPKTGRVRVVAPRVGQRQPSEAKPGVRAAPKCDSRNAKNKGPEGPCEDVESHLFHAKQVVEHVLDRAVNEPLARVPIRRV